MIDDVGGGTAGAWDNVNPDGPLGGGTAGWRVRADIRATPPMARGRLEALEAVADAARAVRLRPSSNICWDMLADALDVLDEEG